MLAELKPYPEYKDEPWPGAVPAHWQLRRAKYVLREIDQRWTERTGQLLSVSQYTGVTKRRLREGSDEPATRSESLEGYKVVAADDLAVNIMLAWNGSLGVAPFPGVVSPAYCVYRFREGNPWYFHNLLRSPDYRAEIKRRSRGVVESRLRLYSDDLFRVSLLLPPPAEQAGIVRFLGAVDRKVNRFIRAKRRLIEVLTEQKQAIITHAVTKGLSPAGGDAPRLKPSGTEWLGDVPAHWELKPLKHLVPHVTVGIVIQPAALYVAEGVPCLRSFNISSGAIQPRDLVYISPQSNAQHRKSQIFAGDIVVVRTGQAGIAAIVTPEFDGANCIDLLIVRKSRLLLSEYLLIYLNSWPSQEDVRYRSVGAIQAHYNTGTLANLNVAVPPLNEQCAIVSHLRSSLAPIHQSIATIKREIDLIREYRTRLVADVVTGKVDVRGVAAPDEAMAGDELVNDGAVEAEVPEDGDPEDVEEVVNVDKETDHLQKA